MPAIKDQNMKLAMIAIKNVIIGFENGDIIPIKTFKNIKAICDAALKSLEVERRKVTGNHKEE